jgi:histidinol dehydrogenase
MKKILNPPKDAWERLLQRPVTDFSSLSELVNKVFKDIRTDGDKALRKYTLEFDKAEIVDLRVNQEEISQAIQKVPEVLKEAITLAKNNIEKFHASQKEKPEMVETMPGVFCWRESRPIEKVGIYVPGGTAPLFSTVLMLGVPARLAGCREIVLCTPPGKNGAIDPAILYTAQLVGVNFIVKAGGIQAVAAMTFGTESIPKVDKIFGPGNQYVTAAKQIAQNYGVAIDMPAGPSEVLIIADDSANPSFVAADLLSQAEHGADSQVILLSNHEKIIDLTLKELENQLEQLPRKEMAAESLANSSAILLSSLDECMDFSNLYAPEHLILATGIAKELSKKVICAGSVFLGNYSCESAGDYASGTNHTLPTNGYARNYSGVSLDSFLKKITFQEITSEGIKNIGPAIEKMADAEQLFAHKNAVSLRLKEQS